ncbi:helix-turn-helix domain-containing protein [Flavobacterium sp. AC]|uniref:Helix-turn-helix domain-containing protein n=1 Tax=Flavobacterium azizsancarii TaxID=2961580 RepID=A0ABT4WD55_9FLAO|nr:AraC family transcriptional regulator [Flavobacterium azizsancarii]MDA6070391.1 helix-turn-helix domain-containing protein [Flavobacterium azizsancarii]
MNKIFSCLDVKWSPIVFNVIILFTLTMNKGLAQKKVSFDSIIYHTSVDLASKNSTKAMQTADSLYTHSIDPVQKVKSIMLMADLQKNVGDFKKAIDYAIAADTIAESNSLYEWQVRISGFLSAQYRTIGLKEQSLLSLKKVLVIIVKIKKTNTKNQLYSIVNQQIARYSIDDENYLEAISHLDKSSLYIDRMKNSKAKFFNAATNNYMLGQSFLGLKNYKVARKYYDAALLILNMNNTAQEGTILSGFIYSDIGRIYFEKKDLQNAELNYSKALVVAVNSDFLNLQEEIYYNFAVYYENNNDVENYKHYSKLYENVQFKIMNANKEGANNIINRLQDKQTKLFEKQKVIIMLFIIGVSILLVIIFVIVRRKIADIRKFKEIIHKIENVSLTPKKTSYLTDEEDVGKKDLMSKETEMLLLKKLQKFEEKNTFTNNHISLSSLSSKFDINSKYLSYVINKHKGMDFYNYINTLRIYYIIKKMESDPIYLSYKISYLAEECGFSSHSKFASIFKSTIGMSPSTFMEYLVKKKAV